MSNDLVFDNVAPLVYCEQMRTGMVPFHLADAQQLIELVAPSHNDPVLGWAPLGNATPHEFVNNRVRTHAEGSSRHWMIFQDAQLAGFFGVRFYRGRVNSVGTDTYLLPQFRGGGLNRRIKSLAWLASVAAGVDLVASIAWENARSQRAMEKLLHPLSVESVFEPWYPRHARLYLLSAAEQIGTGDGTEWCPEAVESVNAGMQFLVAYNSIHADDIGHHTPPAVMLPVPEEVAHEADHSIPSVDGSSGAGLTARTE